MLAVAEDDDDAAVVVPLDIAVAGEQETLSLGPDIFAIASHSF